MRVLSACVAALLVLGAATSLRGQAGLRFVSPDNGGFVSGVVSIEVAYDGPGGASAVEDVTFFANGRQICTAPGAEPRCSWDAGDDIREHALRVVARLRSGGRAVANLRTRAAGYTEAVRVEVVQLNAVVQDGGRFVKGLTVGDFQVFDDGDARPITSFDATGGALELVLALDVSGSMDIALDDVREAARTFLAALGPKDQVTIVAFNDSMFTLAQRESDAATRSRALDRLSAWGGTSLYDVIVRSLDLLSRQPGRRALVVFSDGDDRSSQASFDHVRRVVGDSDATLFAVGLGRGARIEQLRARLEELTDASGGRALFAEESRQLARPFADIVEDLSNQYALAFEPRHDGLSHRIDLTVRGGYRVRTRRGYTAPAPEGQTP